MGKNPTPKLDALRAMREDRYARSNPPRRSIDALKESIAAIPVKKLPRKKRR